MTHVVHVVLSKDGAAANGTVPGSTYLRAPVRAPSGTFVPHGSERRTLGRSTQLPNGPRYPSTTTEDLLRQGARLYTRARVCRTWLYERSHVLHSSVTLPPREDMCRSLSQVHCQQL